MTARRFPPPVRKIETKGRVFLAAPRTRAVTALPEPEGLPSRSWRGRHHAAMPEPRRFPPPWSVEGTDACFIVRDANGQALAYVYFAVEPTRGAAKPPDPRIRVS